MKKLVFNLITLLSVFAVSLTAQTSAVSTETSLTYHDDYNTYTATYAGTVYSTDSLYGAAFSPKGMSEIFNTYKYMTSSVDSAKLTLKLQYKRFANKWTTFKTIVSSDSVLTQNVVIDTLTFIPDSIRPFIYGETGNGSGTGTGFNLIFDFIKSD